MVVEDFGLSDASIADDNTCQREGRLRVSVAAAIRYVTELHAKTTDQNVRKNADRTLAALKRQH
jgi:hypothetical protein